MIHSLKLTSQPAAAYRCAYHGLGILVLVAVLTGCASVKVRKVPTPTQYSEWTDRQQKQADEIEGFRFYLPRPFVNVFESFPVRTDIFIANGFVSPDGKYVIIERVRAETAFNDYMVGIAKDTQIPVQTISPPTAANVAAAKELYHVQSTALKELKDAVTPGTAIATGGTVTKPQETAAAPASPSPTTGTGTNKRDVRNDNGAFAYQPMRGNMDIAYLPDFEEQYAVTSRSGLGNAQFSLNLGQGWSMQSFNSLSDNSELNKRIFDVLDESISLAKAAAKTAMGIPPVDLGAGVEKLMTPHSSIATAGAKVDPGAPVSLKIVVVHYAAKGLYPVIKPRELQERLARNGTYYMFFDLFYKRSVPATAFDQQAIRNAQSAIANETGRFTVPRYPYQYLSFNTFRYMNIELIRPEAKPFEHLYDKTGTAGDPGDRQGALPTPPVAPATPPPTKVNLDPLKGKDVMIGEKPAFKISNATGDPSSLRLYVGVGTDTTVLKYALNDVYEAIVRTVGDANLGLGSSWVTKKGDVIVLSPEARKRVVPDADVIAHAKSIATLVSGATANDRFAITDAKMEGTKLTVTVGVNPGGTLYVTGGANTPNFSETTFTNEIQKLINAHFQSKEGKDLGNVVDTVVLDPNSKLALATNFKP